jgi:hypothetical protein
MSSRSKQDDSESDILWGIGDEIARYLRVPAYVAYELAKQKKLPLKRWGFKKVSSTKRELDLAMAADPELLRQQQTGEDSKQA